MILLGYESLEIRDLSLVYLDGSWLSNIILLDLLYLLDRYDDSFITARSGGGRFKVDNDTGIYVGRGGTPIFYVGLEVYWAYEVLLTD